MPDLIYIVNRFNIDYFKREFDLEFNQEFLNLNIVSNKIWYESHYLIDRATPSNMLWPIKIPERYLMPEKHPRFLLDWETITDHRAQELEKIHGDTGLPISICWSGGIDSTCIVAAVLRNFSPQARSNVTILLDNCSYFENPHFFNTVIKKNFKIGHITECQRGYWSNHLLVTGEPADPIWLQADVLEVLHRDPECLSNDLHTNPDSLLDMIESKTGNRSHAEWFWQYVIDNAAQAGHHLQTYEDFYWWTNFNFFYTGNCIKQYTQNLSVYTGDDYSTRSFDDFCTNYIPWYATELYQQWSMSNNGNGIKINGTIQSYKEPAKRYIKSVDNNLYYYHYKTKTGSGGYSSINSNIYNLPETPGGVCALYGDGSVITFADKDRVRDLFASNSKILA